VVPVRRLAAGVSTALVDLSLLGSTSRRHGIGRYAADLGRALAAEAGASPHGIGLRAIESLSWVGPPAITDDVSGAVARLVSRAREQSHASWAWQVRLRLADAVRRSGADVVHSLHPNASPIGAVGCHRIITSFDLIGTTHATHYAEWRDGWAAGRRWLDTRRYRRADHVIAISESTAGDLVRLMSVPARKITVVLPGIDRSRFSPAPQAGDAEIRARHGLGDRPYLLYIGAADWRKNFPGMIDALAALTRDRAAEAPALVWIGEAGPADRARVRGLAANRGVADRLLMLGWVADADLCAILRGAAALLLVSRAEGFGYPIAEAMASGCAVIAGRSPAAIEVAGDAAIFVDPERPLAIADAAAILLRDDHERRRFVERGLIRARALDLVRMADETLDVYERCLRGCV